MGRKLLWLPVFMILAGTSFAQNQPSQIRGTEVPYAGKIIEVHTYTDLITKNSKVLCSDTVNPDGSFLLNVPVSETQLVLLPLGIFQAVLFLEPGRHYQVVLPEYQPKTLADILNPYFQPVEIYLGISNPDSFDINLQVADFNERYHGFIDANSNKMMLGASEAKIDSVIELIESKYTGNSNLYFRNFRNYKYAWLKYGTVMRDSRYVVREYFRNQPILYENTSYMDLFNQLFTNYLSFYMNSKEGQRLYSDIAYAKSPTYIYQTFSNNMALTSDSLQELVLLKGLYDAFYTGDFPIQSLLVTLDSIACCPKVACHAQIAQNIRTKVLQARVGFPAPTFELYDAQGNLRKLSDFQTNYIYLNFISVKSFPSQQDLELMKQLYERHQNDFKLVSISIDEDIEEVQKYFNEHGYNWPVLSYMNHKNIIDEFKVKAYPTYYLIDPEGNLVMSPANSPSENFEWSFFKLMQSKMRNQNR
ncbi:MAG TPA: hypothetical protein DCQ26_20080 [Marinilabiliales bacterium]|nr:MAG: hypothetical protein A2W95_18260 [Bacteroidetes bacterium GWA2_40_14]OFX57221.1 MAG: hypothetical protein A2W84_15390 [Bacteroidetes bacterium GWC2_40_13]OFX72324.1 MAG: hypothetical protein A2W96_18005 [Bacteroidetes bacterium GWD2_40_43]OFX90428.1 MAG: hypothetical protein A2W97_01395 [Bacteroidetes bacterium GWE2_40_63]OFY17326.1 MAG: hypothetical protein A2W88_15470 [Bacteroidetes bacterium GWF2_40_13]OFZ27329.1 MAG: hypothetical protein A2437_13790 [Bacteroidetes bacterium RIFOXYC